MPRSEAQKRADKKYAQKNMKITGIKHSIKERAEFDKFAKKHNLALSNCIRRCVMYCIENDIDIENYLPKSMKGEE